MRPNKPDEAKRSRQVGFRLTDAEYLPLEARAQQAGLKPNELARLVVVQGPTQATVVSEQRLDPAFIKGIQSMGVTLLRIEKDMKAAGHDLPELVSTLGLIRSLVKEAVERRVPA